MARVSPICALALAALAAACASTSGPPPRMGVPPPPPPPPGTARFSAADFAWSQRPGENIIAGRLVYRQGPVRYTCAGSSVVLTPETPWSSDRMSVLYGPGDRAILPSDDVRTRADRAPPGDAGPYVRRTTCDDADQFAFGGLPDGAWYAITIARPAGSQKGPSMALMRRVATRGGKTVPLAF